jgi:hypothetical protein
LATTAPHRSCTGGGQVWQLPPPTGPAPVEARFGNYGPGVRHRVPPTWPHACNAALMGKRRSGRVPIPERVDLWHNGCTKGSPLFLRCVLPHHWKGMPTMSSASRCVGRVVILGCLLIPVIDGVSVAGDQDAPVGRRPYEMDWAGRTEDTRPPTVDFERPEPWTGRGSGRGRPFSRSREQQLFGQYVGRLVYRSEGPSRGSRFARLHRCRCRRTSIASTCGSTGTIGPGCRTARRPKSR